MTKKLGEKAYKLVMEEQDEEALSELKDFIKKTLQKKEEKKAEREKINEEIRILDKDLEDLKAGNLDNIKERQQKSPTASNISQIQIIFTEKNVIDRYRYVLQDPYWFEGTYNITSGTTGNITGSGFYYL